MNESLDLCSVLCLKFLPQRLPWTFSNRPASSSQPLSFLNRIPPSALTITMSSQQQIDPKKQQGMSYIWKQAHKCPQILTLGPHNRAAVSVYEFQEHPPTTSAEDWRYRARSWGAQVSLSFFFSKGGIELQSLRSGRASLALKIRFDVAGHLDRLALWVSTKC